MVITSPDINRLMAAFAHEKADRVPNWEVLIDDRATRHILGLPPGGQRVTSWTLSPAEAVRLAEAVGQDAILCSMTWGAESRRCSSRDSVRSWCCANRRDAVMRLFSGAFSYSHSGLWKG